MITKQTMMFIKKFKRFVLFSVLVTLMCQAACGSTSPAQENAEPCSAVERLKQELATVGVARFTATDYKPGLIRHIVFFRYNAAVSSEQKQEVIRRFLALRTLAKRNGRTYILSIETGSEISGEGLDQCFEQGFIVTFKSQGDRNYYVGQPVVTDPSFYDPVHQAFKDFVGPMLDRNGAFVFDFPLGNRRCPT
jgi:hypothetical protein